jgi:putative ABC transport system permease protein
LVSNLAEAADVEASATRVLALLLAAVASVALLVGGIGIMNIMLASVTERTREIGVRRAIGAKRRDITMQFLVETVVLSVGGGLVGVCVGVTIPFAVAGILSRLELTEMQPIVTVWSVLLAFGISGAVGIIFGLYPAKAAARLDPIDALRHE